MIVVFSDEAVLTDTNIVLRLIQPAHPQYPLAFSAVSKLLRQEVKLCVAPQNLVEFWVVATRPIANNGLGMNPAAAIVELRKLRKTFFLLEGVAGIADAWTTLVSTHNVAGKQAHDANLVATMLSLGVHRLLTFNGSHFRRYGSVEVIEPASLASASI